MVRSSLRTAVTLSAFWWLAPTMLADKTAGDLGKPGAIAAAEKAARDTLAQFDEGDAGWKVRMEAWVRLVKAGPAAVPVLEQALKKESPAVRAVATQAIAVMRGPAAVRKVVTYI